LYDLGQRQNVKFTRENAAAAAATIAIEGEMSPPPPPVTDEMMTDMAFAQQ
jgi:hypothetical protein